MSGPHFSHKANRSWTPEFQAVILAGYGTSLQPLTNDLSTGAASSVPTPKALLPVGNMPMIFHPIQWLQSAGISDIRVVCPASHKPLIHEALLRSDESSTSFSHVGITFETLDDSEAASLDTADILRKFSNKFVTDLIVLPCDFIAPKNLSLSSFLNDYRVDTERPLLKALLYERGENVKDGPDARLYGIDKRSNSLVYVDNDEGEEELEIEMSLLWRYPNTHLTRRFLDSHVYIVRHVVLELINQRESLESFKEDFLPWVCKLPYRKSHRKKYLRNFKLPRDAQSTAINYSSIPFRDPYDGRKLPFSPSGSDPGLMRLRTMPSSMAPSTDGSDLFKSPEPSQLPSIAGSPPTLMRQFSSGGTEIHSGKGLMGRGGGLGLGMTGNKEDDGEEEEGVRPRLLRCGVALHRMKDGYAGRANTIGGYFELNRQALAAAAAANNGPVPTHLAPTYGPGAQISSDSQVARSARIGERTSIKKSVIGSHCMIGKNVKISGCVIMDYVEIKDGAKLDNSIISRNVLVGERAQLKDCELAPGVTVQNESSLKGERLSQW
ncbi:hypothetical protein DL93DRAFT_2072048 [Clavulina sp. PMI_390]|nr:hypothetical protein DL93DRAFT_2072048 [Clavulina sp. PMI_390]